MRYRARLRYNLLGTRALNVRLRPVRGHRQGGYTLLEMLISLTVLLIGMTGIISLQQSAMRQGSYTRHAQEAAILAEDKLEYFRTTTLTTVIDDFETVDEQGIVDPDGNGFYRREWTVVRDDTNFLFDVTVTVSWDERGNETHSIVYFTQRAM